MLKLFTTTLLLFLSINMSAQNIIHTEIGVSAELINGRSWGGVASLSAEVIFPISHNFSINGLFRGGSGFGWFGAVEHRIEMDDDVLTYREASTCFIYNFEEALLEPYLGCGVGLFWGRKANDETYLLVGIPFMIGSKIRVIDGFKIGLRFMGIINSKTTLTGIGLNLLFEI